jgi:photosystem II stability/assembly factor-like uncharacterized protein
MFASVVALYANETFAQWSKIPNLEYTDIHCLLATSDSTLFVGGDNATLLRSTDNGSTWTSAMGKGIYADTVLSLEEGFGYIFAGANGVESVYRSSDNGASWSAANVGLPLSVQVNSMTSTASAIYAATNSGVYSSIDSGGSWVADTVGLNMAPWYEYPTPGGTIGIIAVDSALYTVRSWDTYTQGGVYVTVADSIAWMSIGPDSLPTYGIFAIAVVDANVFVAAASGVYLYSGSNQLWLSRSNGLPADLQSCIMTTADSLLFAYIGLRNGQMYVTSDLGKTWSAIHDSTFTSNGINAMVANKEYLFAGTNSGGWRIPIADIITSVNNNHHHLQVGYVLYQNYPNPFNPTTIITYQLLAASHVTLKVYDVLGREVRLLVNERESAGSHSAAFDGSNLPSGVYIYRLQAGSFTQSKKLALLK